MRLPDLEAWAVFAAVADHLSFTAAGRALSLSKATVSKAVSRLETHIGAPLFNRTSRRLALTRTGEMLAERARAIVAAADAAEACAREEADAPTGLIRVAAPLSFGLSDVAPHIAAFLAEYPGITIDLVLSDERADIIGGGFDLALRIAALSDSSLRSRRVRPITMHVVAAPAYLAQRGTPRHPDELGEHQCLCYALLPSGDLWRFTGPDRSFAEVQVSGRMRVNNGDAMLPALRAGLGIALLPDFIVGGDLAAGRLISILTDWQLPDVALHLVSPPTRLRNRRVELLAEWLVASLQNKATR